MSRDPLPRPCYRILLRPEPRCADPVRALRQLLKAALRQWKLRAVSVSEAQPNEAEHRQ